MKMLEKIERHLAEKGWTQDALERRVALAQNRISRWKGGLGEPTARQALRIARALEVPVEYLLDDSQEEPAGGSGLTEDELIVLNYFRVLKRTVGLDAIEASVRMAGPTGPGPEPPASPLQKRRRG